MTNELLETNNYFSEEDDTADFASWVSENKRARSSFVFENTKLFSSSQKRSKSDKDRIKSFSRQRSRSVQDNHTSKATRTKNPEWNSRIIATENPLPPYDAKNDKYCLFTHNQKFKEVKDVKADLHRSKEKRWDNSENARSSPTKHYTSLEMLKAEVSTSLFDITASNISTNSAIRNAYEILSKANADALKTISQLQRRLSTLTQQREDHKKSIEIFKTKVNATQEKLDATKIMLDRIESDSRRKDKMISELQTALKQSEPKQRKREKEQPLKEQERVPAVSEGDNELTHRMNIKLVNELAEMKRKYELLESQAASSATSSPSQSTPVENVTMAEVVRLKKKLKYEMDTRKLLQQQVEEIEGIRERNEKLHTFLTKEKEANKRYASQISTQEKELNKLQEELRKTVSQSQNQNSNMSLEADQLKTLVNQNSSKVSEMEKRIAVYEKMHEESKKQLSEHGAQRQGLTKQIEEEKAMLKRVTTRVTSLEREKLELEEKLSQYQTSIDHYKKNDLSKDLELLRNQLADKDRQLLKLESENRRLQVHTNHHQLARVPIPPHIQEVEDLKTRIQQLNLDNSKLEQQERKITFELTQKLHESEKRCNVLSEANGLLLRRLNQYEEQEATHKRQTTVL